MRHGAREAAKALTRAARPARPGGRARKTGSEEDSTEDDPRLSRLKVRIDVFGNAPRIARALGRQRRDGTAWTREYLYYRKPGAPDAWGGAGAPEPAATA